MYDTKLDDAVWTVPANTLRLTELEEADDSIGEPGSWWRDLAAGSALAAFVVTAAVMFLK